MKVLQGGPYLANGSPLLLKIMPRFFKFSNEVINKFPVWVQLRSLPLELWTKNALSRICSKIGNPIFADQLTTNRIRVSYARILVEVDISKEIVKCVDLVLPGGERHTQRVFYENLPKICAHCRLVGHLEENCKEKAAQVEKAKEKEAENIQEGNVEEGHHELPEASRTDQAMAGAVTEAETAIVSAGQQGSIRDQRSAAAKSGDVGIGKETLTEQNNAKTSQSRVGGPSGSDKPTSTAVDIQKQQSSAAGEKQKGRTGKVRKELNNAGDIRRGGNEVAGDDATEVGDQLAMAPAAQQEISSTQGPAAEKGNAQTGKVIQAGSKKIKGPKAKVGESSAKVKSVPAAVDKQGQQGSNVVERQIAITPAGALVEQSKKKDKTKKKDREHKHTGSKEGEGGGTSTNPEL